MSNHPQRNPYHLVSPEAFKNPYPLYQQMRQEAPACWMPEYHLWFITRYNDVQALLCDHRILAASGINKEWNFPDPEANRQTNLIRQTLRLWLIQRNPPDHTRLRKLLSQGFKPHLVDNMRPRIQALVDQLLDKVQANGQLEVIADIAYPLPAMVLGDILGIPIEGRLLLRDWSQKMAFFFTDQTRDYTPSVIGMYETITEMTSYIGSLIADRRQTPQDDLLSGLVHAEEQGETLTEAELIAQVILLLFAGHETSQNLIGNGLHALLSHPSEYAKLKENPELVTTAVEEFLRYDNPVQDIVRNASVDIELHGQTIRANQKIMLVTGSANRDPTVFTEPDRLDITRTPNPHLTFGYGIHYCLGAPLARLEGEIVFNTLLRRLPNLRFNQRGLIWRPSFTLRGLSYFPITFDRV